MKSKKTKEQQPDLLGATEGDGGTFKSTAKKSAAPELDTLTEQRHKRAVISGLLAGMPRRCELAKEAIDDLCNRAIKASTNTADILEPTEQEMVRRVIELCGDATKTITLLREWADVLSDHNLTAPKNEEPNLE